MTPRVYSLSLGLSEHGWEYGAGAGLLLSAKVCLLLVYPLGRYETWVFPVRSFRADVNRMAKGTRSQTDVICFPEGFTPAISGFL